MSVISADFVAESRKAFTAEHRPTLQDLKERIEHDGALADVRRRDLLSALNRIQPLLGRSLDSVPATAPAVRTLFTNVSAATVGVSAKTLANIRSLIATAVREYGSRLQRADRRMLLAPAWQALLDQIAVPYQRHALSRLAAFCSVMSIPPEQIDERTLIGFHTALEAEELIKGPRSILKNTISNWNRCRRTVAGWPDVVLSSPFKKTPYTLPLSAFPSAFRDDVASWITRVHDPDPLDPEAPARPLRQSTIDHRILQFRQFASALVHRGDLALQDVTSIAVLLTPERFKSGLRFFLDRQGSAKTLRLYNLANALRLIAKHHCRLDTKTLTELERITKRVDPHLSRQMTPRNRERLRQFDDPQNVARLLRFPQQQAAKAQREKNQLRGAKRMERALAVALMTACCLRMGTLRALEIADFHWSRPNRQGVCHLSVPGHKTKTDRPLEFELSEDVVDLLRLHLTEYRPRLPGADGPYVFPGTTGGLRARHALRDGIERALLKEAGLVMHPHLFRHAVAKITVELDPGAYLAVSRVLGHTTLNTTMAHYLGTETKAAARHLDRLLEQARNIPSKGKR